MPIKLQAGNKHHIDDYKGFPPLDSKFLRLNSHNYLLVTTFKVSGDARTHSLHCYRLNDDFSLKDSSPRLICEVEHIRSFREIKTPWGAGIIMADHGVDVAPFRGSKPKLLIEKEGELVDFSDKLNVKTAFYFDAIPVHNPRTSSDDIVLTVFPSTWSQPTLLSFQDGLYREFPENLPVNWRNNQFAFMTGVDLSDKIAPGGQIMLGICDSLTPNLDHNLLMSCNNEKWQFNEKVLLPKIQKKLGWGTVYAACGKQNNQQKGWHVVQLNHNHGYSDAVVQVLFIDEKFQITEEKVSGYPVGLSQTAFYFHKTIFFDIDGDGENEILITTREIKKWDYENWGSDLLVLKRDDAGIWNFQSLFFQEKQFTCIENVDSVFNPETGVDSLLVKYFSNQFYVVNFKRLAGS